MNEGYDYPKDLHPDPNVYEKIEGTDIIVPAKNLKFKRWTGKPLGDDFGRKPVIDFYGRPMFPELAIQKLATRGGWTAFWQEVYPPRLSGPYYYADWKEDLQKKIAKTNPVIR